MFSPTIALFYSAIGDGLRTVLSRQIEVKTSRPLRNLADGKLVLGALQKFGEVVTFKHVNWDQDRESKHADNNSRILAIYDSPEAASKAIDASPLIVDLPPGKEATSTDHESPPPDAHPHLHRSIRCEISSSKVDHHNDIIQKNPYYGPWSIDHKDKRIKDIIAAGAPRHEFADCFPMEQGSKRGDAVTSSETIQGKVSSDRMELVSAGSLLELLRQDVENKKRN